MGILDLFKDIISPKPINEDLAVTLEKKAQELEAKATLMQRVASAKRRIQVANTKIRASKGTWL